MKRNIGFIILICIAAYSQAASYVEVYGFDTIIGDNPIIYDGVGGIKGPDSFNMATDGEYFYHILSNENHPAITKVDPVNKTTETLVNTMDWAMQTGTSKIASLYNLSIQGDDLVFADTSSNNVWKVNKYNGSISAYASLDQIFAATPDILNANRGLRTPADGHDGKYYFYEKYSESVLVSDGSNVSTFIGSEMLLSVADTATLSGGLTFDNSGNMIWGNGDTGSLYLWNNSDHIGQELLSKSMITSLTGGDLSGFGDIFYAPDGKVYFYETKSDSILSFDPDAPEYSLEVVLSEKDLLEGPLENDFIYSLSWYEDNIAFSSYQQTGLYVVPEPMTLSLISLGSLVVLGKRKR